MCKKYTFSDFSLEQIFDAMDKPIAYLNEKFQINAICGQIAGGRAMGLSGRKSDSDFDIFYRQKSGINPPPLKCIENVMICDKEVEVEFNFINLEKLEIAAKSMLEKETKGYPTNFYRNEADENKYSPENILPRWEREEYLFTKFHTFVMGDNYWFGKEMLGFDMSNYYKMEKVIDALDYYFIRAYGNYSNYISTGSELLVRRYLNCIWQVLSCEWILQRGTRPAMNINILIEQMIDSPEIKDIIGEYYDLNCNADVDKKDLFCESNQELNAYIYNLLSEQKNRIEKYNRNKTINEIMLNTRVEERQRGYFVNV